MNALNIALFAVVAFSQISMAIYFNKSIIKVSSSTAKIVDSLTTIVVQIVNIENRLNKGGL